ncbi:MAG: nicotinate-nucleotide adenylyltransferase [Bacilli bacterium]
MRRGLFGGTFDPPHVGHLMTAALALECLPLDVVEFIPASLPPHKIDGAVSPADQRVRMTECAVAPFRQLTVSRREIERPGISYTIDTLRSYRAEFPADELFWLLGADMLRDFPNWRQASDVARLVTLAVAPRPQIDLGETTAQVMRSVEGVRIAEIAMPALDISSSWLRGRLEQGLLAAPLLPAGVFELIAKEGLYRS